jgi:hypothetical protein
MRRLVTVIWARVNNSRHTYEAQNFYPSNYVSPRTIIRIVTCNLSFN